MNISSFLTFPHSSDCLIYANHVIIIVLLLQMMGGWEGWGWFIYDRVWVEGRGGGYHFFFIFFVLLLSCYKIVLSWLVHDSCCICFFVHFLLSLSLVPLIRCYWCIEIVLVLQNYFKSEVSDHLSVDFLEKRECLDFNHSLRSLPYVFRSDLDFYVKFIISTC